MSRSEGKPLSFLLGKDEGGVVDDLLFVDPFRLPTAAEKRPLDLLPPACQGQLTVVSSSVVPRSEGHRISI